MSSKMSSKIGSKSDSKLVGWDSAIHDAEVEILKAKQRIAGLRSAVRVFKQKKEEGEPFPLVADKSESTNE